MIASLRVASELAFERFDLWQAQGEPDVGMASCEYNGQPLLLMIKATLDGEACTHLTPHSFISPT